MYNPRYVNEIYFYLRYLFNEIYDWKRKTQDVKNNTDNG